MLDGMVPQAVAARLMREIAEAGMARSDARFLCDDEANHPGTRGLAMLHRSNAKYQVCEVSQQQQVSPIYTSRRKF